MANDPRKLVEIKEYCSLLDDKDEIQKIATAISGQTAEQLASNLTVNVSVVLKEDGVNKAATPLNKHFAAYIKANIASLLTGLSTYVDSLVAANKAEAEAEAGLLGMTTTATSASAPTIISDATATATAGEAFSYDIVADNNSGAGITSCTYSATGLPSWATLDESTGEITGTVPSDVTDGDSFTMVVKCTTNVGEDSKSVTVTYANGAE